MGLDMYLQRTKKQGDVSAETYYEVDDLIGGSRTLEEAQGKLTPEYKDQAQKRGESFTWFSIFEEVAYWRKENHIHRWFVEHVQGGVDECQPTMVSKAQLESLVRTCESVLRDPSLGPSLLPTQGGFFFGPTDYDDSYLEGVKSTIDQVKKVLASTGWDAQVVFYRSSW